MHCIQRVAAHPPKICTARGPRALWAPSGAPGHPPEAPSGPPRGSPPEARECPEPAAVESARQALDVQASIVTGMLHRTRGIGWDTPEGSPSLLASQHAEALFPKRMRGAIVMAVEVVAGRRALLVAVESKVVVVTQ